MRVHDRHVGRLLVGALGFVLGVAITVWSSLPKQDPSSYFNFADQRMYLGIPNFSDVVSNLLFIYVGLWGMLLFFTPLWLRRPKGIMVTLFFVNLSVFCVGWGSSIFHMSPDPASLFWDRAPMAAMFMALLILIFSDRAPSPWWSVLLLPAMAVGVWSAWHASFGIQDIRYYVLIQFGAILMAFIFLVLRKALFLNNALMYSALAFYAVAKFFEVSDHATLELWGVSGHTLKHIVAAIAVFWVNLAVQIPVKQRY